MRRSSISHRFVLFFSCTFGTFGNTLIHAFTINQPKAHPISNAIHTSTARNALKGGAILSEKTYSLKEDAKELLDLLLESQQSSVINNRVRIEELIDKLTQANVEFDPTICIDGPLFCALYQKGPVPFWEKYSFNLGREQKNLKGQRFTKRDGDDMYDVLNYAQLVGESISLEASGVFRKSIKDIDDDEIKEESDSNNGNPFKLFSVFQNDSLFGREKFKSSSSLKCPVDFTGDVKSGKIKLFGKQISLDIKGTGYLRVLYADPSIRIFTTPKDATNDKWSEKSGLTVVQVRVDLVNDSFTMK